MCVLWYDLFICDEVSQYADAESQRLFRVLRELPHNPVLVLCGDFQQLPSMAPNRFLLHVCQSLERHNNVFQATAFPFRLVIRPQFLCLFGSFRAASPGVVSVFPSTGSRNLSQCPCGVCTDIREELPSREMLEEYFAGRYW